MSKYGLRVKEIKIEKSQGCEDDGDESYEMTVTFNSLNGSVSISFYFAMNRTIEEFSESMKRHAGLLLSRAEDFASRLPSIREDFEKAMQKKDEERATKINECIR
jgi:hypothetical protein